jgi:RHS repeat-associated protein
MPTKEYQEHEGVKDASTLYVGYNYDTTVASGEYTKGLRPTSVRYPNARLVHLTYGTTGANGDALGRVESIKDDSGGSPGTSFSDYSYLGSGTIVVEDYAQPDVKLNYDSGTAGTYAGFDRFGRVVDQLWYDYGASADRDRFTYGYDRASSRLFRDNTVASAKDEYYTYDEVNRLATFDRGDLDAGKTAISGTPVKEEDWALDMTGNWTDFLQKSSGTTDLNQDRAHNPVNEITGITETVGTAWVDPVHDRAGNMTTMPKPSSLNTALTCAWDAWYRLVEVKQGAVVMGHYEYDALGRRVKSHVDSQSPGSPNGVDSYVHYFYNSGWQELESRVSASENTGPESLQPTHQYVWSRRYIDAPVLRDKNTDADGLCDDERFYCLGDANVNITTLVNTAGDAVERYVYTPYGVLTVYDGTWANIRSTSSYANAYTYTGRQLDAETGLYYYRARVYAPQLGRFCSRDPIGYNGGINLLAIVEAKPVNSVDPSGFATISKRTTETLLREEQRMNETACCEFSESTAANAPSWAEEVECDPERSAFGCCRERAEGGWTILHVRGAMRGPCERVGGGIHMGPSLGIGGAISSSPGNTMGVTPGQVIGGVATIVIGYIFTEMWNQEELRMPTCINHSDEFYRERIRNLIDEIAEHQRAMDEAIRAGDFELADILFAKINELLELIKELMGRCGL